MASKAKTAPKKKTADDWVLAALRVLAVSSIADVKVERLAEDLGVTKGSFYWHFADRGALLAAMRDLWVRLDTERVIEIVDADVGSDDPIEAIKTLISLVLGTSDELDGLEGGVREWSAHDSAMAAVCAEVDRRRLGYVSGQLVAAGVAADEAEKRAHLLYRVVIGEYVWRRHGGSPLNVATVLALVDHLCR